MDPARKRELVDTFADEWGVELLVLDGLDAGIIGVAFQGPTPIAVAYDEDLIIKELTAQNLAENTSEEEDHDEALLEAETSAREHFDFNVQGSYMGPHTPIIVMMLDEDADPG